MKLHLPTRLRAAVIAAMAFFALAPAAQAEYDNAAATYAKVLQGKSVTATAAGLTSIEFPSPVSSLRGKEWTMLVSATGFNTFSSVFLQHGSGVFSGGAAQAPDWLDARLTNGFGFMVSNGTLLVATSTTGNYSGNISSYGYKLTPKLGSIASVDLVLGYTPTGWDDVNMAYTSGNLSVMSGSVTLSNGQVVQISNTPIFTDISLAGSSAPMEVRSTSNLPTDAATTVTVILPGDESNWTLTGLTSLQKLEEGSFYADKASDTKDHTALAAGDKVYFIGGNGVLFADEDATFTNEIGTSLTMDDPTAPAVIGLGAAANKTLTMENGDAVIATAEENGGLKVTGAGSVQLNCVQSQEFGKLTIDPGATLRIDGAGTVQTLKLSAGATTATSHITLVNGNMKLVAIGKQPVSLGKLAGESADSTLQVEGDGTLYAAAVETAGTMATAGAAVLVTNSVQAKSVQLGDSSTMNVMGAVTAETIETNNATFAAAAVAAHSLTEGSGDIVILGKGGNAFTAQQLNANAGGVSVAGVQDAVITLAADTFSSAGAVTGATFKKGASSIAISSATGALAMTAAGLQVGGAVEATDVTLADYNLTVGANLTADTLAAEGSSAVTVQNTLDADTVSLGGASSVAANVIEAEQFELSGAASGTAKTLKVDSAILGGATTLTEATLANAVVSAAGANFSAMEATEATLGDNYMLAGVGAVPAVLKVGTLSANNGSGLSHVEVDSATTIVSSGSQLLQDVVFHSGYAGYTDGADAIFTVGDTAGLTDVHLSGSVSAADGVGLSKIVVNGETIEFTDDADNPTIVTLVDSAAGVTVPTDYELNITPFVEAVLVKNGDALALQGFNNREVLVEQLSDTKDRASAMESILEVYDAGTLSDEMNEIFKYLGRQYMFGTTPEDLERSLAARRAALEAVSGSSLANLTDVQRRGIEDMQKNLRNRIVQMGGQEEGILHGWDKGNVQAWAQGDGAFHTLSSGNEASGYDFDAYGATVGANVDLNSHWTVGGAISAELGTMTGKGTDRLDADTESVYVNFFGRYQKGHWTQLGIFTIGKDSMETTRRVLDYTAEGSTSGSSFSGYYELGYLIPLDDEVRQVLQPIFNVSLTSAKLDGFTETGSIGNVGLDCGSRSLVYGSVGAGARYQAVLARSVYERNSVLELRGQVNQHFGDSTDEASVSLLGGGSRYTVHGATSGDFGVQLGAGITVPVYNQVTLFGDVDGEFRSKQTDFRANIGVRYEF